jgi:hypothetical protein
MDREWPPQPRRLLALAGVVCTLASLSFPYATLSLGGRSVAVAATVDPRSPVFVLPILVVVAAALAAVDPTRGEQLVGGLFGLLLLAAVVGPLFVLELTGWPGPGLWLLFVGWLLVDAADDLDPALTNERADRRVVHAALTALFVAGSVFLATHRAAAVDGASLAVTALWLASGVLGTAAWGVALWWERTADRTSGR